MGFNGPEQPQLGTLTSTSTGLGAPFQLSLGPSVPIGDRL